MWPPAVWGGQRGDTWALAPTLVFTLHISEPLLIRGKARGEDTSLDPTVSSTSPSQGPCSLLTKEHRGPAAADAPKGYGGGLGGGSGSECPGFASAPMALTVRLEEIIKLL